VPPSVFWPVPNVESGLVAFTAHEPPSGADRAATFAIIDAAFAQRRKTLRAALAGWAGGGTVAADILAAAGVDSAVRGETLTVEQFAAIAAAAPGRRLVAEPAPPPAPWRAAVHERSHPHLAARTAFDPPPPAAEHSAKPSGPWNESDVT
jgi:hypothetical protein